jgi:peptide/nickel transport system substrate-binding protein
LIEKIEVVGDYTVQFALSSPSPFFLDDLALLGYIICKDYTERVGLEATIREPMGTGPFKFDQWAPGEYIKLFANEDYWQGRPYLDGILYKVIPESAVQLAALEAGEVEYITGTMAAVEMVKANPDLRLIELPSVIWNHIGFSLSQEKFQDVRVRRAFYNALDREVIAEAVFYGYGYAGNSPMPKAIAMYYDEEVANEYAIEYRYDPEKARGLLAEAGWKDEDGDGILEKDGEPFEITLLGVAGGVELEQLAVIAGEFDICVIQFGVGFTPALQEQYFHSTGAFNLWSYTNIVIDLLLDAGKSTMDEERRKEIYSRYQEEFMEDAPMVLVCTWPRFVFLSKRIQGMSNLELGQLPLLYKSWFKD